MLTTGEKIPHHKIISSIGAGERGEVYPVQDTEPQRQAAVQVFNEERDIDADNLNCFVKTGVKISEARPALTISRIAVRFFGSGLLLLMAASIVLTQPPVRQAPSPMTDSTRPHPRIERTEVPGRRIDLTSLKGARFFIGSGVKIDKPVPLIIHFHGAPWLIEYHLARHLPRAALIAVQLGAGSRAYGLPFERPELFQSLIDEAARESGIKRGWSSITLTGFSAGYGAVRAILRQDSNFARVNNVLLLDGIHASYSPEGKLLAEGGAIKSADLDSFVKLAGEAIKGKKSFVITHSEIFPAAYASTTECADYLLNTFSIKRRPELRSGPRGMQQLSSVKKGRFYLRGYAGNSAPDHIDHLHAMGEWFGLLGIK